MTIFNIISLLGGLAMFLYGMEIMSDGLSASSGSALERLLEKLTRNVVTGVLTGVIVTAVIQSSTATIVLTVGLIGVGILNLKQAVSIVLGANIGTTVTAQIIRLMDVDSGGNAILEFFKPSTLAPCAMIAGIILLLFIKTGRTKNAGSICMGFGVLFSGLLSMTASVGPLSESPAFIGMLTEFAGVPILGIAAGAVITVIVQSSSATVGMLQALSSTGIMTFDFIYPVIMGINLGTCVTTAIVCSIGSSKDARRTGVVHILFNIAGTVLFMIVMTLLRRGGAMPGLWGKIVNSGDIANFQTLFNLVTAVVLIPFADLLVKISCAIVRPDARELDRAPDWTVLDTKLFVSPAVALAETVRSVSSMGMTARENLIDSFRQMCGYDPARAERIAANEKILDSFADTADNYLIALSNSVESDRENRQISLLMQTTANFERIGDYAVNIEEYAERMHRDRLEFSEGARRELELAFDAVEEILTTTVDAFRSGDDRQIRRVEPLEEVVDDMVQLLRERHIDRLKAGICSIDIGLIFMETLTYLERAADQCSTVGMLMLARENEEIMRNHHTYLEELHKGTDVEYAVEYRRQREKYIAPLERSAD